MTHKARNKDYSIYKTFDDLVKNAHIPEKIWKFFTCFTDEKSDTFGNATKSYHKAGWTETKTSKYRARDMYESPLVQRLLYLYRQKTAQRRENKHLSVFDRTDNDLLWAIDCAKEARDYKAVESASMSRAKLHGQLVDKHQVVDPIVNQEINSTKLIEARQLAERQLLPGPVADVEFEPESDDSLIYREQNNDNTVFEAITANTN